MPTVDFIAAGQPLRMDAALRSFFLHANHATGLIVRVRLDAPVEGAPSMLAAAYRALSLDYPAVSFVIAGADGDADRDALSVPEEAIFLRAFDALAWSRGGQPHAAFVRVRGTRFGAAPPLPDRTLVAAYLCGCRIDVSAWAGRRVGAAEVEAPLALAPPATAGAEHADAGHSAPLCHPGPTDAGDPPSLANYPW